MLYMLHFIQFTESYFAAKLLFIQNGFTLGYPSIRCVFRDYC